jgi:pimeloyl-ACP methyl ester carboxylesterase
MRRLWLAFVASALMTSCASAPSQTSGAATAVTAAAATTPALVPSACGSEATAFWLPGPSGSRLEANSVGSGQVAAVFLHEVGGTGMCGFWPYAKWLTAHYPVRAILVNRCGYGASRCPSVPLGDSAIIAETAPAVEWARAHGATRVSLVGSSYGGGDALQAAGVIPHVAAVVDISGDGNDTGADDTADARRLQVPALFAVAPADRYCRLDLLQALYAATPARPKQFAVINELPGIHGWDLLTDLNGQPERLATLVASWIMAP